MNADPAGDYVALVVRLQGDADGAWRLLVDGTPGTQELPLVPLILVVRLWRNDETRVLRGQMQIHGSDFWVPFQSNMELERLIRRWLVPSEARGDG